MKKDKIVLVHQDYGARVFVGQAPHAPEGYKELVNPNTEMVDAFPPELWKLVDSRLVPVTEPEEVRRRMGQIKILPAMHKALADHDVDLRSGLTTISQLPLQIDDALAKLSQAFDTGFYAIGADANETEARQRKRDAQVFLELRHQRHLLVGVILTLLVLATTIFVVGR